jgi:hypothetical protein
MGRIRFINGIIKRNKHCFKMYTKYLSKELEWNSEQETLR